MAKPDVRDIVITVLRWHPPECIFADGAVDRVVAKTANITDQKELIAALEREIKAEEIYCPHEGIDRR